MVAFAGTGFNEALACPEFVVPDATATPKKKGTKVVQPLSDGS